MNEISPDQLDPRLQKQFNQARNALDQGRAEFALPVLAQLVKRHPECAEARRILRRAQLATAEQGGRSGSFFSRLGGVALKISARKDPQECLEQAENLLAKDPHSRAGLELLTEAAERLGWWQTARVGAETLCELFPEDYRALQCLGRALLQLGLLEEAVLVGERMLQLKPGDAEAQQLVKRASVEHSMRSGRWEESGHFSENLHDADKARQLEQASRRDTEGEGMESRQSWLKQQVLDHPEDLRSHRELAELFHRAGQSAAAAGQIALARGTAAGRVDTTLESLEHEYRSAALEAILAEAQRCGDPEDITRARQELDQYRRNYARERAERYPNDLKCRFEYGEILMEFRDFEGALRELQPARRDPRLRVQAHLHLGRAYRSLGFQDLATKEFSAALEGLPDTDPLQMELLYELATTHEEADNRDQALAIFKEIYSRDVNFRDVAAKVKTYYA